MSVLGYLSDYMPTYAPLFPAAQYQTMTNQNRFMDFIMRPYLAQMNLYDSFNTMPLGFLMNLTFSQCANGGSWLNNWFNSPFVMPGSGSGTSSSSGGTSQLDTTRKFMQKVLEMANEEDSSLLLDESFKNKIKDALNAKGTNDEKLTALKAVYNELPSDVVKQVLYELHNADNLRKTGFQGKATTNEQNLATKVKASKDSDYLATADTSTGTEIEEIEQQCSASGGPDILSVISYYNTSESTNSCMIGDIADAITKHKTEYTDDTIKNNILNKKVRPLVNALLKKANNLIEDSKFAARYDVTELRNLTSDLSTKSGSLTVDNVNNIVEPFQKLYVALRMTLADNEDRKINDKYGFLGNIPNDIVTKDTIDDLKTEGDLDSKAGSVPVTRTEVPVVGGSSGSSTDAITEANIESVLTSLTSGSPATLEKKTTPGGTYYVTTNGKDSTKRYYARVGNTIKEIKDVKSCDGTNFTFNDGSKKSIGDAISSLSGTSECVANAQVITDTNQALKDAQDLIDKHKLVLVSGSQIYTLNGGDVSKDKKHHYYKIGDNGKFCELGNGFNTPQDATALKAVTATTQKSKNDIDDMAHVDPDDLTWGQLKKIADGSEETVEEAGTGITYKAYKYYGEYYTIDEDGSSDDDNKKIRKLTVSS